MPDVLLGVDAVEARRRPPARVVAVQLGRQFDARGAGADDRDVQLLGPQRLGLGVGAHAGVDEPPMEAVAWSGVSSAIACSCTPGVPKSLVWLPTAITSVS